MALLMVGHIMPARIRAKIHGDGRKRAAVRIRIMMAGMANNTSARRIRITLTRPPTDPAITPTITPTARATRPLPNPKATVFRIA